ncbi:cytochrome P450 monooxygenase/CYP52A1 [Blumeria hordei DH14]|uniref:Cytochrome P450 monooxygenase/CYP52A1 n=1 Tax=Blumeria graminis f. sp. hordei (strain DH14) TaxID=546991 RepID=N1J4S4_BLUG1|nr:cytochrome P450 monooxygenase/CYP52A1 [Blumeria hordei DH14]
MCLSTSYGSIALVVGLLSYAFFHFTSKPSVCRHGKALRRPPDTLPVIGNGLVFLQSRKKVFSWFVKCERIFGLETFFISVPTLPPGVVIHDPKNLDFVFKNESLFAKGNFFREKAYDLFGEGIINVDSDSWKVQRKAGLKFLSAANLGNLTDVALPQYLAQTVRELEHKEGTVVDLDDAFHELTTQLMGRMAYNVEMHHSDRFSAAFDCASAFTAARFQNPLWRVSEFFSARDFRTAMNEVKLFGANLVSSAKKSRELGQQNGEGNHRTRLQPGSLINSLLDSIEDERVVAESALCYLSAGKDTTGQALSWTFYLLMKNPKALQNARRAVSQFLSDKERAESFDPCSDAAIFRPAALPYVMAVFYESLRLFPPIPFELKECQQPTTLPDGTFLPKNTIVCWCTWAMNRSRLRWSDDVDKFKPERWMENGIFVQRSASEFPVFNGGSRMCLGKSMAEMMATQVIATLIMTFDFELLEEEEKGYRDSLTLPLEGGLPCRVVRISKDGVGLGNRRQWDE